VQPESDMLVALLPQWLTSTLSQPPYFWNIDAVTIEADSVEIRGWALPWRGLPFNRVLRRADGHLMSITNTPDTAMAAHFPYWPNAATAPLTARAASIPSDIGYVAIESVDPANTSPHVQRLDQFSRWLFVPTSTCLAVPPANLISHVGESTPDYYLVSGCTLFN